MALRVSGRVVIPSVPTAAVCAIPIERQDAQSVEVSVSACSPKRIAIDIAQGAAKTLNFTDAASVDYSGITAATFDVWQDGIDGSNILSKSLASGTIAVIAPNVLRVLVTNSDSSALPAGGHWAELWVTLATGELRCAGRGAMRVYDTRAQDA
jgi:hypothetical protein